MTQPWDIAGSRPAVPEESAPLLSDRPEGSAQQYVGTGEEMASRDSVPPSQVPKGIKILMTISLAVSILSFVMLLSAFMILSIAPEHRHWWDDGLKNAIQYLEVVVIFNILNASINMYKLRASSGSAMSPLPFLISCLVDILLAAFILRIGIAVIELDLQYRYDCSWHLAVVILGIGGAIVAIISSIVSLWMLLIRTIAACRGEQWVGNVGKLSAGIPLAGYSLEFHIKLLRHERGVQL